MSTDYKIQHNTGSDQWEIVALVGPHAGKVVNTRPTEDDAHSLVRQLEETYVAVTGKPRRGPAAEAWRIGARHGVNGQVWDNA